MGAQMTVAKADYARAVEIGPCSGVDGSLGGAGTLLLHPCEGAGGMMYTGPVPSGRQCFPAPEHPGMPPIQLSEPHPLRRQ